MFREAYTYNIQIRRKKSRHSLTIITATIKTTTKKQIKCHICKSFQWILSDKESVWLRCGMNVCLIIKSLAWAIWIKKGYWNMTTVPKISRTIFYFHRVFLQLVVKVARSANRRNDMNEFRSLQVCKWSDVKSVKVQAFIVHFFFMIEVISTRSFVLVGEFTHSWLWTRVSNLVP